MSVKISRAAKNALQTGIAATIIRQTWASALLDACNS
jgi:hypothetical protein